ncbi:hypothetical protein [Nautilia sp.]
MKHLFWNDYKIDKIDFNDIRTKKILFEKVLNYSPNILRDLKDFTKEEIKDFLYSYKPVFNKDFVNRRINVLKKILFNDKNVKVKELEWN